MESHYTFLEQDHPLYREYRQLEALLLSTRVAMSTQERETWMATALAKAGHGSDLIISALLWSCSRLYPTPSSVPSRNLPCNSPWLRPCRRQKVRQLLKWNRRTYGRMHYANNKTGHSFFRSCEGYGYCITCAQNYRQRAR